METAVESGSHMSLVHDLETSEGILNHFLPSIENVYTSLQLLGTATKVLNCDNNSKLTFDL
jgi:hypothetical protein